MKILQLTAHFYPNIGGVETHLSDLVESLRKRNFNVTILTYQPLTTKVKWKIFEKGKNLYLYRIPWISGLFYKLVNKPALEFLYLLPGLFLFTPIMILANNPEVIHAHGLVAGFVGVFWGKVFNKKVEVSTHSIYKFPKKGLYRKLVVWVFKQSNCVMGLSNQAAQEIKALGVDSAKVLVFTYWVDLDKFKILTNSKKKLGLEKKFVALFVGRLIAEKGIKELLDAAEKWDDRIKLLIAGSGPLMELVKSFEVKKVNIKFLGKIEQKDLPIYYNAADVLIVPSVHEEGFGRVILESLACGTPVVGAKRGAIPEAMDNTVGRIIKISTTTIKNTVEYFLYNPEQLRKLQKNTRKFAERRYSEKNIETIISAYQR